MSFKEVTVLRKSGNLDAAIEMARADYNHLQDYWGSSALFWCLNDKYKIVVDIDERQAIVNEMHKLAPLINDSNGYVARTLASADRAMLPHYEEVRAAEEMAKNGDAMSAYNIVHAFFEANELALTQYENFGWIIYRALHQKQQMSTEQFCSILNVYFQLQLSTPSMLHSCILSEAVAVERTNPNEFQFTNFIEIWNLQNLRAEDWLDSKTHQGFRYSSLAEKVISLYMRELQENKTFQPSDAFIAVLAHAVEKWPDNDNLIRAQALVCIRKNQKEEALKIYKQLVLKFPDKFYLWSELAMLVDDVDVRISLLCRALCVKVPEDYVGKLHLSLANMLIQNGNLEWAKAELDKYKAIYERNKWHLSGDYSRLYRAIPACVVGVAQDYADHLNEANALVYSDIPSQIFFKRGERMVDDVKKQRKIFYWELLDQNGSMEKIKPKKFGFKNMPDGQFFEVKKSDDKVRYIKPIGQPNLPWIKKVSGPVFVKTNAQGKRFSIIKGCYIHDKYLRNVNDGNKIEGIAVCINEKWQCISLSVVKS